MNIVKLIRLWGRKKYDSFYCKKWSDIECFGGVNPWHVYTAALDKNSIIYSAGVGNDISFEKALVSRFNVDIHLFDPSPTGIETMKKTENKMSKIHFSPIGLADHSGIVKFSRPDDEEEGSFKIFDTPGDTIEFQCCDLFSLMQERGHLKIDLLKIDIEGFEYDVIDDILKKSLDVRQLCVEFHHFIPSISKEKTLKIIAALKDAGFVLIYKTRFDYTFLRKS